MELHERIAFVRKAAGLTQEQLGEKLGVTRQAVSKWESAQATPDALTVARLCTELGVSADFVLLGKEPDGSAASAPPITVTCPCCGKLTPAGTLKCQGCGYDYYPTPPDDEHRYAVILREGSYDSDFLPKMALFSGWEPEQCRQANAMMQTYGEAHREFVLLRRSLSRSAAMHIAANLSGTAVSRSYLTIPSPVMPTPSPTRNSWNWHPRHFPALPPQNRKRSSIPASAFGASWARCCWPSSSHPSYNEKVRRFGLGPFGPLSAQPVSAHSPHRGPFAPGPFLLVCRFSGRGHDGAHPVGRPSPFRAKAAQALALSGSDPGLRPVLGMCHAPLSPPVGGRPLGRAGRPVGRWVHPANFVSNGELTCICNIMI